jgi:hypothetical protein
MKWGCYTLAAMRRWFLIFLVVFLPVQLSWAAVANYCEHESEATTQHVGHHEHQHQADDQSADSDGTKASSSFDADCGACHAGCCTAMLQAITLLTICLSSDAHGAPALQLSSHPAALPERPNWADLA